MYSGLTQALPELHSFTTTKEEIHVQYKPLATVKSIKLVSIMIYISSLSDGFALYYAKPSYLVPS